MELPRIQYPAPSTIVRATAWARDWRLRWFGNVGSMHCHYATGELVAFYCDERDPTMRLALQAELEAQPNGVAQVLAAHQEERAAFEGALAA